MKIYILNIIFLSTLFSIEINGNGTTGANFLEIDVGSAATALGGAYFSFANDNSSAFFRTGTTNPLSVPIAIEIL